MTKDKLLEDFSSDFKKSQGALIEILEHNRAIDANIVEDLLQGDYTRLEEHIEISKIIMKGVEGFNDLYKNTPYVLENVGKLPEKTEKKTKVVLADIMKEID